jgi:anaerobic selenocysteine-containing dehydrogenase
VRLGVAAGNIVRIRSRHGHMRARVESDDSLRPGLVSVVHGFGAPATLDDSDPVSAELSVNRLIDLDERDPISGIPRMSNVPVSIEPLQP